MLQMSEEENKSTLLSAQAVQRFTGSPNSNQCYRPQSHTISDHNFLANIQVVSLETDGTRRRVGGQRVQTERVRNRRRPIEETPHHLRSNQVEAIG